jgi:hypothetical protein
MICEHADIINRLRILIQRKLFIPLQPLLFQPYSSGRTNVLKGVTNSVGKRLKLPCLTRKLHIGEDPVGDEQ